MGKFMVLVKGTGYTNYVHDTIESASKEAQRLFVEKCAKMGEVHILEIVGVVKMEEVPVVEKKMTVTLPDRLKSQNQEDDLPF